MSAQQKLQALYDQYQQRIESLSSKLVTIQSEIDEHEIVLSTLVDVPPERKCFRMIGGALVELTVKDALVVLKDNLTGMKSSVEVMKKESVKLQKEFLDWKEKNNIKIVKAN
ncbi:hypothetical protein CANARDRAFT_27218 [[Candida] arabinofermentans NRRL YB-2248]|uniref:Prefoldin subunit 2 n=1 Tax=[Candida] arabinofermentans NRRL YB-2248 TaxID=983967 RepID=A0A1E4T517_9ASCO|nr:hypothetical protein CANARDRAFT_27218 [[Candida] arabinofermentans NRRL YB-2248]